MKKIWTHRNIERGAEHVWELLSDPEHWSTWGPSVRSVALDGEELELGATGTVTTIIGARLGFEITAFEPGSRWAWKVEGIDATDHKLEVLGPARCRVGFGVPVVVAPYQLVCQVALHRIKQLAEGVG